MKYYILILTVLLLPAVLKSNTKNFQSWFNGLKLKKDNTCLINCTIADVDMNTFDCHSLCAELCQIYQQNKKQYIITNLSSLYPGLTPQEKALAASHPKKMLKAYQLT